MFRGSAVERTLRGLAKAGRLLRGLKGRSNFGPDFIGPATGAIWDLNTPGQAAKHIAKHGKELILLLY